MKVSRLIGESKCVGPQKMTCKLHCTQPKTMWTPLWRQLLTQLSTQIVLTDYQHIHIINLRIHILIITYTSCAAHGQSFFHEKQMKTNTSEDLSSHNSSCAYIVQFRAIQARTSISRIVPIAEHSMSSKYLTSNGIRYAPAGVPLFHVGI